MRWLTLYARSRQVSASFAATVIAAVGIWALGRGGGGSGAASASGSGPGDAPFAALALSAGVAAASVGLGGQDLALDRTAAIRWAPRRAAHVLLAAAVVAAVALAVRTLGDELAGTEFIVRDSAGLMGLAALGAAACGGAYAWTLPVLWTAVGLFVPPPTNTPTRVAAWLLLPAGTPTATWTALTLTATGTAAYALAGPRGRHVA
ncbi:hypothetical protein AB0A77_20480 [Streptomyces varsoviensis]|uniref:hypothetical protein n=1 Tax=Streptomyces varsoviensis TaxID=67373 RepID=UPI00340C0A16